MIKVEGYINNLEVEDSKILSIGNLVKQAANTALIGTLLGSPSIISNAPIMALAAQGESAKTFTGEVNGYPIIGQFTTIKFKNGTPVIAVISDCKEEGRHLAYSVLDPNSGLLYMMYEMGRSVIKGRVAILRQGFYFSTGSSLFILLGFLGFGWLFDKELLLAFIDILPLYFIFYILFLFFFTLGMFLPFYKSNKFLGEISEEIFEKLKFKNVKNQDFYDHYEREDGIHLSVMKYKESLIGEDPYPEDYFDKNTDKHSSR